MTSHGLVGNPRFFARSGPHSINEIAAAIGCPAPGSPLMVVGLAPLSEAQPDEISFVTGKRVLPELCRTTAGAVIVSPAMQHHVPAGCLPLVAADPALTWRLVAALFHPEAGTRAGTHPSAVIAPCARIDPTVEIGPNVVIGRAVEIGPNSRIDAGAVIGDGVVIGAGCVIGAQASVSHALIGARVHLFPGARIGQEGFGFAMTENGFVTIPHLGLVILEDDVHIGANSTIDRGSLRHTVIGAGTRIDNLVQVAHGVRIGRCCAIAAQVGISGSVEIGDFVVIGGQAGVADHMRIGDKARVGAQSGVMSAIEAGATVVSSPARPAREVFREIALVKKLAQR